MDPPARSESDLLEIYKISVEEYRFQVRLNWDRSRYYLVLNAAIIASSLAVFQIGSTAGFFLACYLFLAGLVAAVLSGFCISTQSSYYRAARDKMKLVEEGLRLGQWAIATTPAMGSTRKRWGRVKTFHFAILSLLGALDLTGFIFSLSAALKSLNG